MMGQTSKIQLEEVFDKIPKALDSNSNRLTDGHIQGTSKIPANFVLIAIASILIVLGALASITSIPHNSLPPTEKDDLFDPSDLDLETREPDLELDEHDAVAIPLCCSIILIALYYSESLVALFKCGCVVLNIGASVFVYSFLFNNLRRLIGKWTEIDPLRLNTRYRITLSNNNISPHPISWFSLNPNFKDPLNGNERLSGAVTTAEPTNIYPSMQLFNAYIGVDMIPSVVLSLVLVKWSPLLPFYLLPVIPMNYAIYAITWIQFKNLKSATLILSSFLIYDLFLFYTPLAASISQIDLPVKIQLPTVLMRSGDIILPGAFTSLCYKFDIYRWHLFNPSTEFHLNRKYWGIYASTALLSYIFALTCYCFARDHYQITHPALFYIASSQLISILCVAWWTQSFEVWNFHYEELAGTNRNGMSLPGSAMLIQEECIEEEDDEYIPGSQEDDYDCLLEDEEYEF